MTYRNFKRLAFSIAMLVPAMVVAQPCSCPRQVVRGSGPASPLTDLLKGKKSPDFPKDPATGLDSLLGRLHYADLRRSQMAGSEWTGLKIIATGRSLRIPVSPSGVVINLTPCIDSIPGKRQVINSSMEIFPGAVGKSHISPTGAVTTCKQSFRDMMQSSEMDWPTLLQRLGEMQQDISRFQGFVAQLAKQAKLGLPGKKESPQDYFVRLSEAVKSTGGNLPEEAFTFFLHSLEGNEGSVSESFLRAAQGIFQGTRARLPQLSGESPQPGYVLKADISRMAVEFPSGLLSSGESDTEDKKGYSYLFPVRELSWTDLDGITVETGMFSCGPRLKVGTSGLILNTGQAVSDLSAISSPLSQKYCGEMPGGSDDEGSITDLKKFTGIYWPSGSGQILLKKDISIPVQFRHVFADAGTVHGKLYISCIPKGKNSFGFLGPDGKETDFTVSKLTHILEDQGFSKIIVSPVDLLGNGQFNQVRIDFQYTLSE